MSKIVGVALLRQSDLNRLVAPLAACFAVPDDAMFDAILAQLDAVTIEPLGRSVVIRPEAPLTQKKAAQ